MGNREHRPALVAGRDRAPGPRAGGALRVLRRQGRSRRRGALRHRPHRGPGDQGHRRDPRPEARLRALHGGPGRHRRAVSAARVRRERRVDPERVSQPGSARSRCPPAAGGCVCPRGRLVAQHRLEPRVHHRGAAARPDLAAASPGPPHDRRIRRHVVAQFAGADLRPHGFRPRPRQLRPARRRDARWRVLRRLFGDPRGGAVAPPRLGGGDGPGGGGPQRRRRRRRSGRRPAPSAPNGCRCTASAMAARC